MTRTAVHRAIKDGETQGLSGKAVLGAALPLIGGLLAVVIEWVATGEFSRLELATALSTGGASLLAFAGAYAGNPGVVVGKVTDQDGGAILGLILALAFGVVAYLLAAYLGLPFILAVILGILGIVAGWLVGRPRPEL